MAHLESQLSAADVRLVPDRTVEVVTPGTATTPADSGILHPALRLAAIPRWPAAYHRETTNCY
ncbi:hypothetical protein OG379_01005 [Streptomyces sp. NBC_01166]|uniref:hypothetical protein n=1 Tax=Streptomyces sp. NBC_01166 TaxID=2903755 RepID=UPI00386C2451|nr:hypothetical protein OG379_01005 [Streptomyces sp. NBC_01166]